MEKKCECECHKRGLAEKYSGELREKIATVEEMPCVYCVARHAQPAPVDLFDAADDHDGKTEPGATATERPKGFPF